jgi:hypothetical protein
MDRHHYIARGSEGNDNLVQLKIARAYLSVVRRSLRKLRDTRMPPTEDKVVTSVNLIFACETYLKLGLMLHGIVVPKTHDLHRVFSSYPNDLQTILEGKYSESLQRIDVSQISTFWDVQVAPVDPQAVIRPLRRTTEEALDLRKALLATSDSYHNWRYLYQRHPTKTIRATCCHVALETLCEVLDEMAARKHAAEVNVDQRR